MNLKFISGNKGKSEQTSVVGRDVNYQAVLKEDGVLYKPQSLFFPGKVTILNHLRKQLSDVAISKIEGLIALYSALSEVRTYRGFLGVLTLYIKTHSSESIMSQLQNIVTALFSDIRPQDSSRPKWLDDMSLALTDWKLLLNSPSFSKVSRVLSLLVTLGIMERKSVNLGNFELFAIDAQNKQSNAIDLVDALIETVVFFAEGAYQCFLTGSVKPLLFSSSEVIQLEEAYIKKVEEWEYVRNGNLERFTSKTEAMFDKELDEILDKLHNMYKTMPSGVEKKIVQQKWEALSKIRTEFIAVRVSGGLRKAPYCVKVYGDSGVGKSTFADITMVTVLKAMGLPSTSDYVCTLNESDKYMSTYRSYITGIKMDDYGNTKMDFWETSPSDWIIKICNNIREYAVMADIANKGKITIEPGCLTITTNVEDMHASKCSYNAMSILRRAHTHVELNVRPEFLTDNMLDSYKVLQKFGSLDQVNDIWLVTIKKPIGSTENSQTFAGWDIIKEDISIFEYMSYLVDKVKTHSAAQTSIVDSFKEPSDIVHFCDKCCKCSHDCDCDLDPQFGDRIAKVITDKVSSAKLDFSLKKLSFETKVEDLAVDYMLKACNDFWRSPYAYWTSWMPESIMSHPYARAFVLWTGASFLAEDVKHAKRAIIGQFVLCCIFWLAISPITFLICFIIGGFYTMTLLSNLEVARQNAYLEEICKRRGSLHKAFISAREKHVHYACGIFAGLTVLYGVVQVVKALKDSINVQGMLAPKSIEDIRNRDKEVNPWNKDYKVLPKINKTFSGDAAGINAMQKVVAQIEIGDNFSNALMLQTHVVMFPLHLLPKETIEATILYGGRKIRFILNPGLVYKLPNKDAVVAYVPNSGPFKDITGFFMESPCKVAMTCKMVGTRNDQSVFTANLFWQYVDALHNGFTTFAGSHYVLSGMDTFNGMCMSPIITQNGKCAIVGVHIGGVSDTPRGCGMSLTKPEIDKAISNLYTKSSTFLPGPQASEIEDVVFNKKIAIHPEVHWKCPTNFITGDCDLEVYGSVTGRSTYNSDVIETPISSLVEEVCGVPNKWGAPKFTNPEVKADGKVDSGVWKPWFASLEVCSKPSIGFDPKEVDIAMDDYLAELTECFNQQFELWKEDMRPLTDIEIVSGIDGKRFIDSMPAGTSMGYPLNGPKRNHLIDLEPTDEHSCPRTFTKEIWDEVDKLYALADSGKSLNQIFGASLKDEPTSLSKDKVRVFQAAPIALQILVRKYFLPIGRFLSINPLIAECAVGINSFGPEWNELSQHMAKFGDDRIIAGDYSKYDLRMPAQLTLSAFSVMIRLAILSNNYSKQDIKRMFVIAHEVCTPLIAYNGTLMRFLGTNPSGQNMTVYVNSIVNSLLHRLAFQSVYPREEVKQIGATLKLGRPARFRDLVALATYGDDAKGSVREGYDKFNHVSMANYLEANDMKFTMPDKESDPVPFMNRYRADFLKRTDRFDENLGVYVGMLNESSIFKSLHSILKSKVVSPRDVSAMNIEGALREWFFHGEEKFELRRSQMQQIAQRADLFVRELDKDYATRVEEWKEKYVPQSGCHINKVEDALKLKVKMTLGTPTICDEPILIPNLGRPDLVYVHPKFIMLVETKVLKGKRSNYKKVVYQATKYATAVHILRPDATVVGMIYTENGFEVVKHFGDYKCPKKYVKVLDASLYNNDSFMN